MLIDEDYSRSEYNTRTRATAVRRLHLLEGGRRLSTGELWSTVRSLPLIEGARVMRVEQAP